MTAVLDTHAFVWALRYPDLLSAAARDLLDHQSIAYVSTVSLYEIAGKVRLGKWPEAQPITLYTPNFFLGQGFRFVDVTPEIALRAGRMPGEHRDPFDRLIAATALEMALPIVSADVALDLFGVRRIW